MKKIIALILAFIMSIGVLAACSDKGDSSNPHADDTSDSTVTSTALDIASFTIIKGNACTDTEAEAATALRLAVKEKTGKNLKVSADVAVTADDSIYEILIGRTNRQQSSDALNELGSSPKFTVRLAGNKIIIASAYDTLTLKAVAYFVENVVSSANENGIISFAENYVSDEFAAIKIMECNELIYSFVQDADAPNPVKSAVSNMVGKINAAVSADLTVSSDTEGDHSDGIKEILLGNTSIPASDAALSGFKEAQYGIISNGNKLCVLGKTHATSEKAIDYLTNALQIIKRSDGKFDVCILFENDIILDETNYYLDFIKPTDIEGVSVSYIGNVDIANFNMQYVYENADSADYQKYCETLVSKGFTQYDSNQIGNCLFATYSGDKGVLTLSFTPNDSTLRVISAPKEGTELAHLTAGQYTPLSSDPSEIALISIVPIINNKGVTEMNGLSMVITLDDGSYIIVDGGETADNAAMLYEYLSENNAREDGDIVIAAWFLTHGHSDHYGCFLKFMDNKEYASNVRCESIICSGYSAHEIGGSMGVDKVSTLVSKFKNDDCKVIKLHTGQNLQFRNAAVDVLYTHEDMYPTLLSEGNDTSTVLMVTVNGKKIMLTGDATPAIGSILAERYGEALRCDYLQVPHHGGNGGAHQNEAFVNAAMNENTVALIPTTEAGKTAHAQYLGLVIAKVGEGNCCYAYGNSHNRFSL